MHRQAFWLHSDGNGEVISRKALEQCSGAARGHIRCLIPWKFGVRMKVFEISVEVVNHG